MWFLVWLGILVCVVVINLVWVKITSFMVDEDDGFIALFVIDSIIISILVCMYLVAKGILVI